MYGAALAPEPMVVAASSSNTVSTRSSPPLFGPPTCSISLTVVELSGLTSSTLRSPTKLWSMLLMRTLRSLMRPLIGTNSVDCTPPASSSGMASVWVREWVVGGPARPVGIVTGTAWVPPSTLVTFSSPVASTPQAAALPRLPSNAVAFSCSESAVMSG